MGQLRVDDPSVSTPQGFGLNPFKDRGAIDRVDFIGPTSLLINPPDNDALGIDLDPAPTVVVPARTRSSATSRIRLLDRSDPNGPAGRLRHRRPHGQRSQGAGWRRSAARRPPAGRKAIDYAFSYDSTNNLIVLTPLGGLWPLAATYRITLDNSLATRHHRQGRQHPAAQPARRLAHLHDLPRLGDRFRRCPQYLSARSLASNGASHQIVAGVRLGRDGRRRTRRPALGRRRPRCQRRRHVELRPVRRRRHSSSFTVLVAFRRSARSTAGSISTATAMFDARRVHRPAGLRRHHARRPQCGAVHPADRPAGHDVSPRPLQHGRHHHADRPGPRRRSRRLPGHDGRPAFQNGNFAGRRGQRRRGQHDRPLDRRELHHLPVRPAGHPGPRLTICRITTPAPYKAGTPTFDPTGGGVPGQGLFVDVGRGVLGNFVGSTADSAISLADPQLCSRRRRRRRRRRRGWFGQLRHGRAASAASASSEYDSRTSRLATPPSALLASATLFASPNIIIEVRERSGSCWTPPWLDDVLARFGERGHARSGGSRRSADGYAIGRGLCRSKSNRAAGLPIGPLDEDAWDDLLSELSLDVGGLPGDPEDQP